MKLVHVYNGGTASGAKSITFYQDSTLFIGAGYAVNLDGYSVIIRTDTAGNVIKTKNVPLYGMPVNYSVLTNDNKVLGLSERYAPGMTHWETCLFKFNQELEYDSIYTQPRVYDSLCPHAVAPNQSISLDCVMVDTDEPLLTDLDQNLKLYPNPASDLLTVALPNKVTILDNRNHIKTTTTYYTLQTNKMIQLVNVSGQVLQSVVIAAGQNTAILDVSNLPSGMYLVRVLHGNQIWLNGKVMVGR
jgi:hypothetical protein